ncbi:MAG: right-handed parallel beta-helix repeat-containing protein, partial [bacterium]|nr:right-handed parallel beta-helix repeat-containing protein [bacterium]
YESSGNTIGGLTLATGNIISGSNLYSIGGEGILIEGTNATLNKILGNFIGTDATGSEPMGNRVGVEIDGASDNTIGGSSPGAQNVISANSRAGIRIKGADAVGNRIVSNSIFANDGMGIDLGGDGQPATNDPGDDDSGPNNFQNYPILTRAEASGSFLLIAGELNSAPDTTFELHFYSNQEADSSGFGEGKTFLFELVVQTDHQGEVNFIMALTQEVAVGEFITVTATDSEGNTSEFSPAIVVTQGSTTTQSRKVGLKKRRAPRQRQ